MFMQVIVDTTQEVFKWVALAHQHKHVSIFYLKKHASFICLNYLYSCPILSLVDINIFSMKNFK